MSYQQFIQQSIQKLRDGAPLPQYFGCLSATVIQRIPESYINETNEQLPKENQYNFKPQKQEKAEVQRKNNFSNNSDYSDAEDSALYHKMNHPNSNQYKSPSEYKRENISRDIQEEEEEEEYEPELPKKMPAKLLLSSDDENDIPKPQADLFQKNQNESRSSKSSLNNQKLPNQSESSIRSSRNSINNEKYSIQSESNIRSSIQSQNSKVNDSISRSSVRSQNTPSQIQQNSSISKKSDSGVKSPEKGLSPPPRRTNLEITEGSEIQQPKRRSKFLMSSSDDEIKEKDSDFMVPPKLDPIGTRINNEPVDISPINKVSSPKTNISSPISILQSAVKTIEPVCKPLKMDYEAAFKKTITSTYSSFWPPYDTNIARVIPTSKIYNMQPSKYPKLIKTIEAKLKTHEKGKIAFSRREATEIEEEEFSDNF
ncbi:hypothetical protein TVAG_253580 [Trichomonas vaginalis G3]|uniref:Uncharacterized protein n=1 Tax=Trichomonas vaginalis (strain ATCC PRA-98 / G3) TaxID=412133 RepID=A2DMM5_TRIV3|nr:hypothetical protein TVAGG3_0059980 [Trichomonas vaginalis G3]EAY18246.1 hypothetical protein TVAG_253580 [Trichomonas vaginalis G3]KAI5541933.1 hypothetical protein TVAGG3_0059980 [Trichomonas vaginalis G3]|eukprot:XP_001579232.1 hypothetical protein [Trichomonas vaginalis G3]